MEYARDQQSERQAAVGAGAALGIGKQADVDPWKHRSIGMKCRTCMWFNPKAPQASFDGPVNPRAYDVGRCRRHAPTMGGYPVVFVNDWCGDHRLDENKA